MILCGGAINSPQLLQLSGIGDPEHLRAAGVATLHPLPGVGENLQDHLEVYVQYACSQPVTMQPALEKRRAPWIGFQWLFLRKGPAATNHFEAGGFIRSNDDVAYPNLMYHFLPLAIRYDGTKPEGGHGYQVHVGPMYSDARGSIRIRSADPAAKPALRFNYLSTDQDRREWVEAIRRTREIMEEPALAPFNAGETSPGPGVRDRRGDPRLGARRRRDRAAPLVHVPDGRGRALRGRPADDARARARRPPRRRRLRLPVRHEREHLRADDDGGREGRRPDPRQHAARSRRTRRSTGTPPPNGG